MIQSSIGDDENAADFKFLWNINLYMFKELKGPHNKPHIHAVFSGEKLTIAFDGEIFAGNLPRKQ